MGMKFETGEAGTGVFLSTSSHKKVSDVVDQQRAHDALVFI